MSAIASHLLTLNKASMSHNNVSVSAVYLSGDGQWKLGGLQYLCPFKELTSTYLKHSRLHRYDKAVDPNEDGYEVTSKVDQYSFAVLVEDVFKGRNDDDVPHLKDFKKYCRDHLQHQDPSKRPNLSEVLKHNFFNHEFISIYKFLNFLPLKSEDERAEFFSNILDNLKCYDEETVAKQLSGLLLSRLTMLDQTARRDVIPYILKPKNERIQNGENMGFFSLSVFKEHIKPRLMQLFGVRDSQIRMLLITHFSKFGHVFTHDELSQHILPELLLGIKDIDDKLVASTLICLSELVPILGADTVIGGKRARFFTDGRPNSTNLLPTTVIKTEERMYIPEKSLIDLPCSESVYENSSDRFENVILNERPSPVGGESLADDFAATETRNVNLDSEDDWSDWENTNRQLTFESNSINEEIIEPENPNPINEEDKPILPKIEHDIEPNSNNLVNEEIKQDPASRTSLLQKAAIQAKKNIVDISELDIKNQKFDSIKRNVEEFDFFADMTPVIEKPTVAEVVRPEQDVSSKLNFVPDEAADESEGWGENWND